MSTTKVLRCRHRATWRRADTTDLVAGARSGDDGAWYELVRRFSPLVHRRVSATGLSSGASDDAVQLTWIKLASSFDTIRSPERLAGWLSVTARNEAISIMRRSARTISSDWLDERAASGPPVDQRLIDSDNVVAVSGAVAVLDERQRALVELRFLRDEPASYADITDRLNIPRGSIGPTLKRALISLRADHRIAACA